MKIMLSRAGFLFALLCIVSGARFKKLVAHPSKDKDDWASEAVQHADHGEAGAPDSHDRKDFAAMDTNGDGYLTQNEVAMKQLARASGNHRLASRRARDYVVCADSNKDRKIEFAEYKETVPGVGYTSWYNCVKEKEEPQHAFFAFKEADSNKDDRLDIQELHTSFVHSWGAAAAELPKPFLECCDNDDDGLLSEYEFEGCGGHYNPASGTWAMSGSIQWKCLQPAFHEYDNKMRFNSIDTNGNHWISRQESYDFISGLGATMSMKDADALFNAADINKDNMIDYTEFQKAGENHKGADGQSAFFLAKNPSFQPQLVEVAWVDPPLMNADEFRDL